MRAWATAHDYNLDEPPTEKDDTSTASLPTISLSSPTSGTVVTGNLIITAEVSAPAGVRSVDFSIDGVVISNRTQAPWTVTYDATKLSQGNHEVLVQVTDQYGSTAQAVTLIIVAADETSPAAVTATQAERVGLGSGNIKLTWKNPADADLAKIRVYRSTSAGQLGSLIQEVQALPNTTDTVTINGHLLTTTYYFTLRPVDTTGNETPTASQTASLGTP